MKLYGKCSKRTSQVSMSVKTELDIGSVLVKTIQSENNKIQEDSQIAALHGL